MAAQQLAFCNLPAAMKAGLGTTTTTTDHACSAIQTCSQHSRVPVWRKLRGMRLGGMKIARGLGVVGWQRCEGDSVSSLH